MPELSSKQKKLAAKQNLEIKSLVKTLKPLEKLVEAL